MDWGNRCLKEVTWNEEETKEEDVCILYLNRNFLTHCMFRFSFPHLVELDLGINGLSHFPLVGQALSLKRLFLGNNEIQEIDLNELKSLTQLEVLDLRRNRIRVLELPSSMTSLITLSISQNQVSLIKSLPLLHQLKKLCIFGNKRLSYEMVRTLLKSTPSIHTAFVGGTGIADMPFPTPEQRRHLIELIPTLRQIDGSGVH